MGLSIEPQAPNLLDECHNLNGCKTGKAKITGAYLLPCKWIIHTVGPIWHGGNRNEDELLASCYQSCFSFVKEFNIKSMAFPSISTGAYRFPQSRASKIALEETKNFLTVSSEKSDLPKVFFVCFSKQDLDIYQQSFTELFG